jgi:hypothetical protein
MIRNITFSACLSLLALRVWLVAFPPYAPLLIELSASGPAGTYYFLYSSSSEYSAADAVKSFHPGGAEFHTHSVTIPAKKLQHLRIDPGTATGTVRIKNLCITSVQEPEEKQRCIKGQELESTLRPRRGISNFNFDANTLNITIADGWAYIETVPAFADILLTLGKQSLWRVYSTTLLVFVLLLLLLALARRVPFSIHSPRTGTVFKGFALGVPLLLFFVGTSTLSRATPLFQGPDEPDHLAKLIAAQEGTQCPLAPKRMERAINAVKHLPHHPERTLNMSDVKQLFDRPYKSGKKQTKALGSNACAYSALYVSGPALLNQLLGLSAETTHPVRYSAVSRLGTSIVATILWGACLLLVLFGKSVSEEFEQLLPAIRAAGFLTALYIMFIPQTMWLSAVVSQDYLLIPLGLTAVLSVFLRIRIFSELLLILSVVAGSSKVIYLVQIVPCALLHFAATFRLFPSLRSLLLTVAVGAGSLFFAGKMFIQGYCTENNCYGIETAGVFRSLADFPGELLQIGSTLGAMHLPGFFHRGSAFAHLGWLDTTIPDRFGVLYGTSATTAFVIALLLLPLCLLTKKSFPVNEALHISCKALFIWLAGLITLYFSVVIMAHWCGSGSEFGCGYQRRYGLPVYGIVPFCLFLLPLAIARFMETGSKQRYLFFVPLISILICIQALVTLSAYQASLTALEKRYFDSPATQNRYQSLIQEHLWP